MVNFFIGRPIFATVLALLMLLIGGICIFILPIAQYPQITPPQVQVTTTYTGADAKTVAETVTTPIEQQINGVKGMIYFNSDSTSNGISTIVATFDVGYSQDIGAVDIQNRVETAQAVLPPEVKQFGVTIKKTSTDMVCVVNLVSPDGRYDSTYLDNYAQIYVLDVLKRIPGVSDVTVFGRKYAMRIWLDPDRMANQFIAPAEVVEAIQSENRQAAAGKIGGQPIPPGQVFEIPDPHQGAVDDRQGIRGDRRSPPRRRLVRPARRRRPDRARLGELRYRRLAQRQAGRHAADLPVFRCQRARHRPPGPGEHGSPGQELPARPRVRHCYDTTKYVDENITEVEHTLFEAFVLVLIVVFVFLQGVRATIIPMLAIPVALVATFAMMAAFGFSINTLTLCGLILAIGLVVDDAIIVVENVEKFLERGDRPLQAVRAAMAEITAPIVTITLVLAAVFVPVAFIPGLTGRLYNQFAMTIVFSFMFSAINSLTFSPAMSRLFLRPKHGESKFFFFRWFNHGMRWLENSYDAFLDFTAHHWWTIVMPSIGLLALTFAMLVERPKAFIPTEDQGYLIASIQTPDGTAREATSKIAMSVSKIAQELEGVNDVLLLEGFNVLNSTNQTNSATIFIVLKEWSERRKPELRAQALATKLQGMLRSQVRGAVVLVLEPPPIRGLSQTGGFEFMIEDRDGKGVEALAKSPTSFSNEARKQIEDGRPAHPELAAMFTPFSARVPQLRFELDRVKAERLDVAVSDVFAVLQANLGGYYVNDFNLYGKVWKVIIQAEGDRRNEQDRHQQSVRAQPARNKRSR